MHRNSKASSLFSAASLTFGAPGVSHSEESATVNSKGNSVTELYAQRTGFPTVPQQDIAVEHPEWLPIELPAEVRAQRRSL